MSRPFCTHCLKAKLACFCHLFKPICTDVKLFFLMHRKELRDRMGTGTGRMTHLMMQKSELSIGLDFSQDAKVLEMLKNPCYFPCVLYPDSNSFDLTKASCAELFHRNLNGKIPLIFVIDGSWSGAKKIMKANPMIELLPKISFSGGRVSQFRFRKQPRAECLSTLEAVHEVLTLLETARIAFSIPAGAHDYLLEVFQKFVHFQSAFSDNPRFCKD